jgi:hypothetical protein
VVEGSVDDVYTINEEETGVTIVRNCEYLAFGRFFHPGILCLVLDGS